MKDYYKVLEISKDSEKSEVKRAYFKLVRKFPPDRFPEDFKIIREAYEVLIDEKTRNDYDSFHSMPDILKIYFEGAQSAFSEEDYEKTIDLLEKADKVYNNYSIIKSLLGDAYLANDNSVKAINIFEKLTKNEPHNAGFAGKLANAYLLRGWYKKAIAKYERALNLDKDNISLWIGLIECFVKAEDFEKAHQTAEDAILQSKESGWDPLDIYYLIIQLDLMNDDAKSVRKHVEEITQIVVEDQENKENAAYLFSTIAATISSQFIEESEILINTAAKLLPNEKKIAELKDTLFKDRGIREKLKKIKEDVKVDNLIGAMLEFELSVCDDKDCINCGFEQFSFEMDILDDIDSHRKDILELKKNYPELYNLKKEFFDKVLNIKRERHLFDEYSKKLLKYRKIFPDRIGFEDDSKSDNKNNINIDDLDDLFPEPYIRAEAKVGSNDPCPCGSGKKYKKCCG